MDIWNKLNGQAFKGLKVERLISRDIRSIQFNSISIRSQKAQKVKIKEMSIIIIHKVRLWQKLFGKHEYMNTSRSPSAS